MSKPSPSDHPICFVRPRRLASSAWVEHVPFAMYLIDLMRPSSVVELGARNGVSYCAFCQAVDWLGVTANCVAVDSWEGDAHTGAYGPSVLTDLQQHHDPLYGDFSRLQQSTFDEAVMGFADASIDLLHIDGLHTYEAARHDFETWLPRLSSRGVVLFHDIAEHSRGFGVWQLWAEISGPHPSFAFQHGHGLGVLGIGAEIPEAVTGLFQLPEAQAAEIRSFFHLQGQRTALRLMIDLAGSLPACVGDTVVEFTRKLSLGSAAG